MAKRFWVLAVLLLSGLACNLYNPANLPYTPTAVVSNVTQPASTITPTVLGATRSPLGTTCSPRADWPTMIISAGDTLYGIAQEVGVSVEDLAAGNCMAPNSLLIEGQNLQVPSIPPSASTPVTNIPPTPLVFAGGPSGSNVDCGGQQWFFTFSGQIDSSCPGPVLTSNAVGQNFEGGRVYWYSATPGATDQRETIYVIFNDGTWQSLPNTWGPAQDTGDPSVGPPPGRFQPTGIIGHLWREQPGMRDKLGWAYQPEGSFTGRRQAPSQASASYYYIDHGLRNLVLRLNTATPTSGTWTVVGYYT